MAAMIRNGKTAVRCAIAEVCPSVRIYPVDDAAVILVVSVLVCLLSLCGML